MHVEVPPLPCATLARVPVLGSARAGASTLGAALGIAPTFVVPLVGISAHDATLKMGISARYKTNGIASIWCTTSTRRDSDWCSTGRYQCLMQQIAELLSLPLTVDQVSTSSSV